VLPSPLWWSAPLRLLRSGTWGVLVLAAVLLLSTAAAAAPLFYEVTGNAAWRSIVEAVPSTARVADAPVVRLNGGAAPGQQTQDRLLDDLRDLPGLGEPTVVAGSVGKELLGRNVLFPAVRGRPGTHRAGPALRPTTTCRPLSYRPRAARRRPRPPDGLWLPVPLAELLDLGPGDRFDVGVLRRAAPGRARPRGGAAPPPARSAPGGDPHHPGPGGRRLRGRPRRPPARRPAGDRTVDDPHRPAAPGHRVHGR
jgi:hypothetical protein